MSHIDFLVIFCERRFLKNDDRNSFISLNNSVTPPSKFNIYTYISYIIVLYHIFEKNASKKISLKNKRDNKDRNIEGAESFRCRSRDLVLVGVPCFYC